MIERLLSAWAWVAAVLVVLFGFFYVAAVWIVTAPFDPGRYQAGRAFRRLAVSQVALNPALALRDGRDAARRTAPAVRRRLEPRVVRRHLPHVSHFPWEMKWLSKDTIFNIPVMGWMMRMAGDVPVRARQTRERDRRAGRVPRPARPTRQRHDLPRRHALAHRRAAAVQGRRLPARHRGERADPADRRRRHALLHGEGQLRLPARARARRACSRPSPPTGSRSPTCPRCATARAPRSTRRGARSSASSTRTRRVTAAPERGGRARPTRRGGARGAALPRPPPRSPRVLATRARRRAGARRRRQDGRRRSRAWRGAPIRRAA